MSLPLQRHEPPVSTAGAIYRRLVVSAMLRSQTLLKPFLLTLASLLFLWFHKLRRLREIHRSSIEWQRHVDLSVVQAVLLTTEKLSSLGRIEKRTIFIKRLADVFKNDYIRSRIVEAGRLSLEERNPFNIMTRLDDADRYQVLSTCLNEVSSVFAPYHIFYNEEPELRWKSAWYCLSLTCHQTAGSGRFFIAPQRPVVGQADSGSMRIRILLMSEPELKDVAAGKISPPIRGCFTARHSERWYQVTRFAEVFRQHNKLMQESTTLKPGGRSSSKTQVPDEARRDAEASMARERTASAVCIDPAQGASAPGSPEGPPTPSLYASPSARSMRRGPFSKPPGPGGLPHEFSKGSSDSEEEVFAKDTDVELGKSADSVLLRIHIPFPFSRPLNEENGSDDDMPQSDDSL